MLCSLVYVSAATRLLREDELAELLRHGAAKNASRGVTGALLYVGGNFMHLLEGNQQTVSDLYDVICRDPRHQDVRKVIAIPIEQRQFGNVSMAYKDGAELPPSDRAGMLSLLDQIRCDDGTGRAIGPRLLERFATTMAA